MLDETVVKTTCKFCQSCCGMLVYMKQGKPVRVEGNPDSPVNKGRICDKGKYCLDYLDNPNRLKYPLKRAGNKGEGKWQRISWDEALDTIAFELNKCKGEHGAESVAFVRGWSKVYGDLYLGLFANVFGSPNLAHMGCICVLPRILSAGITYGSPTSPDYEGSPKCFIAWGVNAAANCLGDAVGEDRALASGARLIAIDPAETETTKRAEIWVKPRPCTDLALALGFINVIITENLFDKEFVDNWTVGFDELKVHIQKYSPEKVSEITWVPVETIKQVARLYATHKPGCITSGNGLENNINNFQSGRAIAILRAITGNLGIPGGEISWLRTGVIPKGNPVFMEQNAIPPDVRANQLSSRDKLIPEASYTLPQAIVGALLREDPYPLNAAFIMGANIVLTWADSKETCAALNSLDFITVTDFFMTPTAELADIVLPAATFLEDDNITEAYSEPTVGVVQKVAQVGEARSDYRILKGLAERMNLAKYFPEQEEFLDRLVKPAGLTFNEFRTVGTISATKQYGIHERAGFSTPSEKVELYSKKLENLGFDPLPEYYEPPESPYSEPDLAKEYPLIFTNRKFVQFTHSSNKQINSLRRSHPEPEVSINVETAKKLGIKTGDWVYIENKRGRIRQKAVLSPDINPKVIIADFGWWFPEKSATEGLHGAFESNINVLTSNKRPYAREMGSATLRGILCKVYKA